MEKMEEIYIEKYPTLVYKEEGSWNPYSNVLKRIQCLTPTQARIVAGLTLYNDLRTIGVVVPISTQQLLNTSLGYADLVLSMAAGYHKPPVWLKEAIMVARRRLAITIEINRSGLYHLMGTAAKITEDARKNEIKKQCAFIDAVLYGCSYVYGKNRVSGEFIVRYPPIKIGLSRIVMHRAYSPLYNTNTPEKIEADVLRINGLINTVTSDREQTVKAIRACEWPDEAIAKNERVEKIYLSTEKVYTNYKIGWDV